MAALYIRKRRPATKQVSTTTANGAPSARSCDARICAAPENMIMLMPSAGRSGADAADGPERHEAEAGRQHFREAFAEVGRRGDVAHERRQGGGASLS